MEYFCVIRGVEPLKSAVSASSNITHQLTMSKQLGRQTNSAAGEQWGDCGWPFCNSAPQLYWMIFIYCVLFRKCQVNEASNNTCRDTGSHEKKKKNPHPPSAAAIPSCSHEERKEYLVLNLLIHPLSTNLLFETSMYVWRV